MCTLAWLRSGSPSWVDRFRGPFGAKESVFQLVKLGFLELVGIVFLRYFVQSGVSKKLSGFSSLDQERPFPGESRISKNQ